MRQTKQNEQTNLCVNVFNADVCDHHEEDGDGNAKVPEQPSDLVTHQVYIVSPYGSYLFIYWFIDNVGTVDTIVKEII